MRDWVRGRVETIYERHLRRSIDSCPDHVAIIQDGNRRYARNRGVDPSAGHRRGAQTTEDVLEWCEELGVRELTVYAFSTENFERPRGERESLFDLIETKLREFADTSEVHERRVRIRAIGDVDKLPPRVRDAARYAENRTRGYGQFTLNIALAYGGRNQLLEAARTTACDVERGSLEPDDIDVDVIEARLYERPIRDVDLIIRTGGDERTSNFLPWHANGNEAAVFFCTPYWPEFRKIDFLRGVRTYERREKSWRRTRVERARTLCRTISGPELPDAHSIIDRFQDPLAEPDRTDRTEPRERAPEERPANAD
ncbi:polyprenyl diphosphate synthase [Natrarchaeobius chitinivorans]|uniref:Tritrans,polycis-undecaprenyl-diphosphate synthase (geranylgeranyl-diphosphate specific) n=1 Tax=Natrarchaeobius chitinivorans TaxID=1679083 RepID=A0A3N6PF12_NATCH|nr:polyprenyl diphosphate synthase [Natrarchaeobius chitinivorans]RQG96025.1 di-trans,poly-cis-decaprenylcistransferase [Natrarchaeobius chitinivorans]